MLGLLAALRNGFVVESSLLLVVVVVVVRGCVWRYWRRMHCPQARQGVVIFACMVVGVLLRNRLCCMGKRQERRPAGPESGEARDADHRNLYKALNVPISKLQVTT